MTGTGDGLPFADDEFEIATAMEVLEHVPDAADVLSEMARVSSKWILVSVPREPLWRGLNMARGAYWRDLGNTPGHINHWSKRSFARAAVALRRRGRAALAVPVDDGAGARPVAGVADAAQHDRQHPLTKSRRCPSGAAPACSRSWSASPA